MPDDGTAGFRERNKMKTVCATLFAVAAMATAAVDLPWVYDTSERTFEDVKSVSAAGHDGPFDTMAGNWSYVSTVSHLRSRPWTGLTIVVY